MNVEIVIPVYNGARYLREAIDEWIEANRTMMDEAAAAFDRRQAIKRG